VGTQKPKKAARKKSANKAAGTSRVKPSKPQKKAGKRSGGADAGRPRFVRRFIFLLALAAFGLGLWCSSLILDLDKIVVGRFEGQKFLVPSKVYSAPGILYPGLDAELAGLRTTLERTGYREQVVSGGRQLQPGFYRWIGDRLRIYLRGFEHPARPEPARDIVIRFEGKVIVEIRELPRSREVGAVMLEPELVGAYFGSDREQRELVRIEDVPPHLIDAVLSIEDHRFLTHHGVDFTRIAGAIVANVRAGGVRQGGSTLTQQLVKNFFLTPARTLRRKLQEAVMAVIVETRFSKEEILESYLNEIYLGQRGAVSINGVGEASRFYFGRSVTEIAPAESALLAAIIQGPNRLSPHRNPEAARNRRNLVLELMRRQGRIDLATFSRARESDLNIAAPIVDAGESRYFLDVLRRQLPEVYDRDLLQSDGLKIYSTLDARMQRAATRALTEGIEAIEAQNPDLRTDVPTARLQGCIIAMRPQTGEILALVGGRNYGHSQFDRCTLARRPAGSVFKPFIYLAALEVENNRPIVTAASFLDDSPLVIETHDGVWQPQNYDHEFRGLVSLRSALERSLNVPSVRLALRVGIDRVAEMAERLGVTSQLPRVPSLALGTADVSPMEIARAYATLASGGLRPTPHTFEDLTSKSRTLERRKIKIERVIDPGLAFLGVTLLEGVVNRGTARRIRSLGLEGPVAGKTGTTDDERDLWFVGFTPELVVAVWLGFDEPRGIGVSSTRGPLPIWVSFVKEVLGSHPRGVWAPPRDIEKLDIDPASGALAEWGCPRRVSEYFLVGTAPSEVCDGSSRSPVARIDPQEEDQLEPETRPRSPKRRGIFGWIREHL
jgi:penicillin-binding protein 1B